MIANFAITYRCNSRCSTCNIWAQEKHDRELTIGEIHGFFEGERNFLSKVRTIQLTGGEPYLRGDIAEIARAIWNGVPRAFIWVATNGLLPDTIQTKTSEMLEAGRGGVGVTISIDGIGETHDKQRGIDGAYERAFETLYLLTRLKEKDPRLRLSIGMTITPHNQHQIGKALNLAKVLGVDFTMRPINVSEAYYRNAEPVGEWDLEAIQSGIDMVARYTIQRRGLARATPVISYLSRIPTYIKTRERHLSCSAGASSFFIDPTGDVYPCLFIDERLGSIREKSMSDIWTSSECGMMRKKVAEGHCPGCLVECEAMRDIRRDKGGLISAAAVGLRLSRSS
jgi:MoaA/NifB/PqqE/SkfB family radical SAM enzyme